MIWNTVENTPAAAREAMASYLAGEINSVNIGSSRLSEESVRELARGVAAYLQGDSAAGFCMETDRLLRLTSQALATVGEKELARRLLVFGTGLARSTESNMAASQGMLVIDLKRLTVKPDDCLELIFFRSLTSVLGIVAEAWDETEGDGALGLRGVGATAAALLGPAKARPRKIVALTVEILAHCRRNLESLRALRHWRHVPQLVNLDASYRTLQA